MKINEKDIKNHFNADVVSFSPETSDIDVNPFFSDGCYFPVVYAPVIHATKRELVIDFISEIDMSNFALELQSKFILDLEDTYIYDCVLNSKKESADGVCSFTGIYELYTRKRKGLVIEARNTFNVAGNHICGCIYEITSNVDANSSIIDGMIITNLKANKTLMIDGIDKLVYYKHTPNISAFDDTDLTKFPSLAPGTHTIEKSSNLSVVIKYYPIYI